ncbi:dienelactone hydrolase family protein [Streptomyces sp. NPDC090077]|uniref:dienelactone hydrolase family protein n=1 Tax=Streptomyces sp. NPDC090077 TaxID=3365938 RepID=UPI00381E2123
MITAHEARRLCLDEDPEAAAELFRRHGLDPRGLGRLLSSTAGADEPARSETVELLDAWGRAAEAELYVPSRRDGRSPGLIVGLHGVGSSGAVLRDQLRGLADACGAVLLCPNALRPYGTSSNFDVAGIFGSRFREARWTTDPGDLPARALRWAREHLAVDANRCALVGVSMGGIATWGMASRRWDGLAMAASINGAPSLWEMFGPDNTMRELLPNALGVPLTVVHGVRDRQIPLVLARDAVTHLRGRGHRGISFVEVPEGEHRLGTMGFEPGNPQFDEVVRCFGAAQRKPWPGHVRHRARERAHGRAHWVEMADLHPGTTATVDARAVDRGHLVVRASGCSRLRLFLGDRLVDRGRVLVTVNDEVREMDFRPSLLDAVSTYGEADADPGRMAEMVVDMTLPEIREEEGTSC